MATTVCVIADWASYSVAIGQVPSAFHGWGASASKGMAATNEERAMMASFILRKQNCGRLEPFIPSSSSYETLKPVFVRNKIRYKNRGLTIGLS